MNIEWISENFDWLFWLSMLWVLGWILASVVYRKVNHKGIPTPPKTHIIFSEQTASGRSLKNWVTSVGGARNCLVVTVTKTELLIRPLFPFTLMFLPEIFDLEHQVKLTEITDVKRKESKFRDVILVQFSTDSTNHSVELRLRNSEEFLQVMGTSFSNN